MVKLLFTHEKYENSGDSNKRIQSTVDWSLKSGVIREKMDFGEFKVLFSLKLRQRQSVTDENKMRKIGVAKTQSILDTDEQVKGFIFKRRPSYVNLWYSVCYVLTSFVKKQKGICDIVYVIFKRRPSYMLCSNFYFMWYSVCYIWFWLAFRRWRW